MEPLLKVKKLSENATIPTRGSEYAAGYDLYAAHDAFVTGFNTLESTLVRTDIAIEIPHGYYARIAPRSSVAHKYSIDIGGGVIDEDYRGNIGILLFNHSNRDFHVKKGDRIAQLILTKIITPNIIEVDSLNETKRNENGFGSTGI